MGYRQTSAIEQIWYIIRSRAREWLEWQEAKQWAKEFMPTWFSLARCAADKETRANCRWIILKAYRED